MIYMDRIPDDQPANTTPRCTTTRGYAAIDIMWGVQHGAIVAAAMENDNASQDGTASALLSAALAVVHLYSAWRGFDAVDRCREARAAHDEWLRQRAGQR